MVFYVLPVLAASALFVPNLVCVILLRKRKRKTARWYMFIQTVCYSIILAIIASGVLFDLDNNFSAWTACASICAGCFVIGFFASCIHCATPEGRNREMLEFVSPGKIRDGELFSSILHNRTTAPRVYIVGNAYHDEVRTTIASTRGINDGISHNKVITYNCAKEYEYGSWQEDAPTVELGRYDVVRATFKYTVSPDSDALKKIEQMKKEVALMVAGKDANAEVKVVYEVKDFVDYVYGSLNTTSMKGHKFYTSCCGCCCYYWSPFFGCGPIYDSLWESWQVSKTIVCQKKISDQSGYRCKIGESDINQVNIDIKFGSEKPAKAELHSELIENL